MGQTFLSAGEMRHLADKNVCPTGYDVCWGGSCTAAPAWDFISSERNEFRCTKNGLPGKPLEFRFDVGHGDVAADDLALLVDQDHRRHGEDAQHVGRPAVQPAWLEDLRPGQRILGQIGVEAP